MATINTSNTGHVLKRRYKQKGVTDISGPKVTTRRQATVWARALDKKILRARGRLGI